MKLSVFAIVVVALLLIGLVVARRRAALMTSDDIQEGMRELAEAAVVMAKADHGVVLDYSIESVEKVDGILGVLYERSTQKPLSHEERTFAAVRYGAYIGEVIRRKWDGHWERDHAVAGPGSFPITSQGHQSFPVAWCYKRLKNGPEDNVWHKLQILYLRPPH